MQFYLEWTTNAFGIIDGAMEMAWLYLCINYAAAFFYLYKKGSNEAITGSKNKKYAARMNKIC